MNNSERRYKLVVYTTYVSEYVPLRDPAFVHPEVDYVCFSNHSLKSEVWDVRPVAFYKRDPARTARQYKLLPHQFFSEYDGSIYHDANFQIQRCPYKLVEEYLGESDMAVHQHCNRESVYEEIEACIRFYKDSHRVLRQQERAYRERQISDKTGLFETGVLIRDHNSRTETFGHRWWEEICRYSKRDQVSLPVVLQEIPLSLALFPYDNIRDNPDFAYQDCGMRPDRQYRFYLKMRRVAGRLKRKLESLC